MSDTNKKTLMRNLGEFFAHIVKGVKTDVKKEQKTEHKVVSKTVEEEDRGDVVLRRTTIEELEIRKTPQTASDNKADKEQPSE